MLRHVTAKLNQAGHAERGRGKRKRKNDMEILQETQAGLLLRIEKIFTEKLSRKTGWGRNEVLVAYKDSVNQALMEMLD